MHFNQSSVVKPVFNLGLYYSVYTSPTQSEIRENVHVVLTVYFDFFSFFGNLGSKGFDES